MTKAENIYDLFQKWTKTYGPVHTFWMGETAIVAVADQKLIEETFSKDGDAYAGRDQNSVLGKLIRSILNLIKKMKILIIKGVIIV